MSTKQKNTGKVSHDGSHHVRQRNSQIIEFLLNNGYEEDVDNDSEYRTFHKEGVSSIDVNYEEIILVGETGDWLHIPANYYALIGALLHHRMLATNYVA